MRASLSSSSVIPDPATAVQSPPGGDASPAAASGSAAAPAAQAAHAFERVPAPAGPQPSGESNAPPRVRGPERSRGRDPLYRYQWHLKNRGQYAFADGRPVPRVDLNIADLHRTGITGKGVVVGIYEDRGSVDGRHEDLMANMVIAADPSQAHRHPTMVAGIIAARGWNGKGGRGVAPDARILDMSAPGADEQPRPHVVNQSQGWHASYFEPYDGDEDEAADADIYDTPAVVKSGGNGFLDDETHVALTEEDCRTITRGSGVGCVSANLDSENSSPNMIVVAAVNAAGVRASYSSTGSSLWVSGLGGEYGWERSPMQAALAAHPGLGDHYFQPALLSTDVTGCDAGEHRRGDHGIGPNALDPGGPSKLDPGCDYRATANGTSSAAPTVTGVIALMLQVNPDLKWRDIKYILATTARKVDAARGAIPWQGITLEDGWVTNAAGRAFSNEYGFGLVDAKRAVKAARAFQGLPAPRDTGWVKSAGQPVPIPYRDEGAGYSTIAIDDAIRVEAAVVRLQTTHREPHNLRIALVSPAGTRSIVLPPLTHVKAKDGQAFSVDYVTTNAFLDEMARGEWKLQVIDVLDPASAASQLVSWQLRVLGH